MKQSLKWRNVASLMLISVAPLLYSQCNVLVDASSPWRQRLQHIDITRLTYNAL